MKVPYFDLAAQTKAIRPELDAAIDRVLDSAQFCLGPEVEEFEKEFASYISPLHYCVGVNSGTSALHLALLLRGIGPGDEVITTPLTFIATAWAISYVGATPVFVDVDPLTMNIDAKKIPAAVTSRTKMVIAVHLFGQPADVDAIVTVCREHSLYFLEDCCQAHGARWRGESVGGLHWDSCFSFYPGKTLGACGEGGALVIREQAMLERAKALREHGSTQRYYHDEVGYNYRMDAMQGAVLRVKLKYLEQWVAQRRTIASAYTNLMFKTPLKFQAVEMNATPSYHLFVVRHPARNRLRIALELQGVGTALHYPRPLHLQKCYQHLGYKAGDFPVAEQAADECLSLPMWPGMTPEQVGYVAHCVHQFFSL